MNWQTNWLIDETHAQKAGGQGTVRKAVNKNTETVGALKEMHAESTQNSERRKRMAREINILERLDGKGVPRLFESNADAVDDKSVPLYFVCEWIQGKTLQEVAGGSPLPLAEALQITRDLADVIMHCHNSGIQHRDIKPDNVLINEATSQVCLVDFGIAYTEESESDPRTPLRQELGNRFLRLPELGIGGSKRDVRADITQVVGVLFFLLTGRAPNTLIDEQGRPPHKRTELATFKPDDLADARWKRVRSIFDIGFSLPTTLRFADAATLVRSLDEAIAYVPALAEQQPAFEEDVEAFNVVREHINAAIKAVELSLINAVNSLATEIGLIARTREFSFPNPHAKMVKTGREAKLLWAVSHEKSEEPRVFIGLYARLDGDDFGVVSVRLSAEPFEQIANGTLELYSGPAADTSRLLEEIHSRAGDAFGFGVRLLTQKVQKESL
ncbi:serine/threonine-protein kinase [Paraburkholderia strydomiana]|uniref:serine/threonine-protein kinase n=1 Tax=Paraburkholderia strydomiana TaxID=1245417 RepID=UPI0038BA079E